MGNFFNMIYGVLIKFNQNLIKKQYINEHKLLTINLLSVNKDQLLYTIGNKQTNTLDTSMLQRYKHLSPAGGTLTGTVEYAKNFPALVFLYAHDNVESLTLNAPLAVDFDMNGINKNNRIIGLKAPREPVSFTSKPYHYFTSKVYHFQCKVNT